MTLDIHKSWKTEALLEQCTRSFFSGTFIVLAPLIFPLLVFAYYRRYE